jgi:hypothetical protein
MTSDNEHDMHNKHAMHKIRQCCKMNAASHYGHVMATSFIIVIAIMG